LVVGEGYNPAWSASTDDGSLGAPTLVDGNANGWYLGPSASPTTVTVSWTAQRPVSLALALSGLGALLAIALAVLDRRRSDDDDDAGRPPMRATRSERPTRRTAVLTVAAGVLASAVFIGWVWAPVALILGLPAVILRRNRLLAAIGTALVLGASVVVIGVVRSERPYPGAGWPVRFEWLHGWTLLGVVLLTVSTLFATDARRRSR
jgi:arabinofuranan 3-O-arabinosyltransferase